MGDEKYATVPLDYNECQRELSKYRNLLLVKYTYIVEDRSRDRDAQAIENTLRDVDRVRPPTAGRILVDHLLQYNRELHGANRAQHAALKDGDVTEFTVEGEGEFSQLS